MTEIQGVVDNFPTRQTRWLCGSDQACATGIVVAQEIELFDASSIPTGIQHLHQVFELESFSERLLEAGNVFGEPINQE